MLAIHGFAGLVDIKRTLTGCKLFAKQDILILHKYFTIQIAKVSI